MTAPKIPSSDTRSTSGGGVGPPGRTIYPFVVGGIIRSIKIHADLSISVIFYEWNTMKWLILDVEKTILVELTLKASGISWPYTLLPPPSRCGFSTYLKFNYFIQENRIIRLNDFLHTWPDWLKPFWMLFVHPLYCCPWNRVPWKCSK